MNIINLFQDTIKNKNNILRDELYYEYLKIIHMILDLCKKRKKKL